MSRNREQQGRQSTPRVLNSSRPGLEAPGGSANPALFVHEYRGFALTSATLERWMVLDIHDGGNLIKLTDPTFARRRRLVVLRLQQSRARTQLPRTWGDTAGGYVILNAPPLPSKDSQGFDCGPRSKRGIRSLRGLGTVRYPSRFSCTVCIPLHYPLSQVLCCTPPRSTLYVHAAPSIHGSIGSIGSMSSELHSACGAYASRLGST